MENTNQNVETDSNSQLNTLTQQPVNDAPAIPHVDTPEPVVPTDYFTDATTQVPQNPMETGSLFGEVNAAPVKRRINKTAYIVTGLILVTASLAGIFIHTISKHISSGGTGASQYKAQSADVSLLNVKDGVAVSNQGLPQKLFIQGDGEFSGDVTAVNFKGNFNGTYVGDGSALTGIKAINCADCILLQTNTPTVTQLGGMRLSGVAVFGGLTVNGETRTGNTVVNGSLAVTDLTTLSGGLIVPTGQSFTFNGSTFTSLLGTGLTLSSGALTVDLGNTGNSFQNGGNSFSSAASLGTNDNQSLILKTNNQSAAVIAADGSVKFKAANNSVTAFQIQNAIGTSNTLVVDTVNNRVGVGTNSPAKQLHVVGETLLAGTVTADNLLPLQVGLVTDGKKSTTVLTAGDYQYNDGQKILGKGLDGFPRFIYFDNNNIDLHYVRCQDIDCTTKTDTIVASETDTVMQPNLIIGPDGFARILYLTDRSPIKMHYVQCTNDNCSTSNNTIVATAVSYDFYEIDLTLGTDGFGRIAYNNYNTGEIKYIQCTNSACTTQNNAVANTFNYGSNLSVVVTPGGLARIIYYDSSPVSRIVYVQCTNANCSTSTTTDIATGMTNSVYYNDAVIGSDGFVRVAFRTNTGLTLVKCLNNDCSSKTTNIVDGVNISNAQVSLDLDSNGNPTIAYQKTYGYGLLFAACNDSACASSTQSTIVETGGYPMSMYLNANNLPTVVNVNSTGNTWVLTRYKNPNALDSMTVGTDIGNASNYFGQAYLQGVKLQGASASALASISQYGTGTALVANQVHGAGLVADFQSKGLSVASLSTDGATLFKLDKQASGGLIADFKAGGVSKASISAAGALTVTSCTGCVGDTISIKKLTVAGTVPTTTVGTADTGTLPYGLSVQGKYVYIVNHGSNSLQVFDTTNPAAPLLISTTSTANGPTEIQVSGRYAYVITNTVNNMQIFDIANPANPVLVSTLVINSNTNFLYLQGKYLYVTNSNDNTFQIIDISNPVKPIIKSTTATNTYPDGIQVVGDYAYIAEGDDYGGSFQIFDITNPSSPTLKGQLFDYPFRGSNYMIVQGRYAYVNVKYSTRVIDISNPSAPVFVQYAGGWWWTFGLAVHGRYLYQDNFGGNLNVFDITNPASPVAVGYFSPGAGAMEIAGENLYFLNIDTNKLMIYDLSGGFIQHLEAGSVTAGTITAQQDLIVNQDTTIVGGLNVGRSVQIAGGASVTTGSANNVGLLITGATAQVSDLVQLQDANGILLAKVTANGSVLFQNSSDNATAFQVQNATGLNMFNVDTLNNTLTVGVSDTIGTLLVLDTKTTAGDPTGVNGAMYYNASLNAFRCYENGSWSNCMNDIKTIQTYSTVSLTNGPTTVLPADTISATDLGTTASYLGMATLVKMDGYTTIRILIRGANFAGQSGTVTYTIRNITDGTDLVTGTFSDTTVSNREAFAAVNLTGVKRLAIQVKSSVATDDPLFGDAVIQLER